MTPDLSRRLAAAINAPGVELDRKARLAFARDAAGCDAYVELPQWIKNIVEKAEADDQA